ncbi:Mu-like prophage, putative chitinase, partial [Pseudomonas syringae pv. atrofaciens]
MTGRCFIRRSTCVYTGELYQLRGRVSPVTPIGGPMPINQQQLLQILPNAGPKAGVFVSALNIAMARYAIDTRLRIAAFIAQIGHESGQLRYVRELRS